MKGTLKSSIVGVLIALVLVSVAIPQPAAGINATVSSRSIDLTQPGHVHIVIKPTDGVVFSLAVMDAANFSLMENHYPYATIGELTRTNVTSVDVEADLPAGAYMMQVYSSATYENSAFFEAVRNSVTISYPPSQAFNWAMYGLIAVSVAALAGLVYTVVRKR